MEASLKKQQLLRFVKISPEWLNRHRYKSTLFHFASKLRGETLKTQGSIFQNTFLRGASRERERESDVPQQSWWGYQIFNLVEKFWNAIRGKISPHRAAAPSLVFVCFDAGIHLYGRAVCASEKWTCGSAVFWRSNFQGQNWPVCFQHKPLNWLVPGQTTLQIRHILISHYFRLKSIIIQIITFIIIIIILIIII